MTVSPFTIAPRFTILRRVSILAASVVAIVAVALPSRASAQVPVFFDDFLTDNAGMPANNFNLFIQWNVSDGSVDLLGDPLPSVFGRFVDLGGSTGDPGRFATRTPQPLVTGLTYNLSFNFKSVDGLPASAIATVGSQTFAINTSSTTFALFSQNFTYTDALPAPIVFQDAGTDNAGVGIDTVTLSQVVPEPALGFSALIIALSAMRARRSRVTGDAPRSA